MGKAYDDASSQYSQSTVDFLSDLPATLVCRFIADDVTGDKTLMSFGDASDDTWARLHLNSAELRAQARGNTFSTIQTTSGPSVTAAQEYFGAAVFIASNDVAVQLDGTYVTSDTAIDITSFSNVDRFSIGRLDRSVPGQYMDGSVYEAAVYNVALSEAELDILANARVSPLLVRPDALIAYWPLIGDGRDIVGGNDLTDNGGVTNVDHIQVYYRTAQVISFPTAAGGSSPTLTSFNGGAAAVVDASSVAIVGTNLTSATAWDIDNIDITSAVTVNNDTSADIDLLALPTGAQSPLSHYGPIASATLRVTDGTTPDTLAVDLSATKSGYVAWMTYTAAPTDTALHIGAGLSLTGGDSVAINDIVTLETTPGTNVTFAFEVANDGSFTLSGAGYDPDTTYTLDGWLHDMDRDETWALSVTVRDNQIVSANKTSMAIALAIGIGL